jgi:hypothetical protein
MAQHINVSRIMRISWVIQKQTRRNRSKSLMAAWAIFQNEEIVIQHLAFRLNHNRPVKEKALGQISIFQ